MTDRPAAARGTADRRDAEAHRRRREQIFGDVLPDSTTDDRDPDITPTSAPASEEWLKANVPPHHT